MTVMQATLRMIGRRWRDYVSYLLAVAFSVMVFFVFASLYFDTELQEAAITSIKISGLFQVAAALVGVFAVVFIWYSASLFFARRRRETGTLLLLGMRQRSAAWMLTVENLLVGGAAVALGLIAGSLFHRLFMLILLAMMRLPVEVSTVIEPRAYLLTAATFLAMIVAGGTGAATSVYRVNLLSMFQEHAKSEEPPRAPVVVAIAAIVLISTGYLLAILSGRASISIRRLLEILSITVAGTFLLFAGASYLYFGWRKASARRNAAAELLVSAGQLGFRSRKNARYLAMVAVLNAVSITGVGTMLALYSDGGEARAQIDSRAPYDFVFLVDSEEQFESILSSTVGEQSEPDFPVEETALIRIGTTWFGTLADGITADGVISLATYQRLLDLRTYTARGVDLPRIESIGRDEAVMICAFPSDDETRAQRITAALDGATVPLRSDGSGPVVSAVYEGTILSNEHFWRPYIVVVDEQTFRSTQGSAGLLVGIIDVTDPNANRALLARLSEELPPEAQLVGWIETYQGLYGTTGLLLFIAAFVGVTLILANGSIVAFRQLMEAYETRHRYVLLRNLGFDRSNLHRIIVRQQAAVFGLPFVVGLVHSFVALLLLDELIDIALLPVHLAVSGGFFLLFGLYALANTRLYERVVTR